MRAFRVVRERFLAVVWAAFAYAVCVQHLPFALRLAAVAHVPHPPGAGKVLVAEVAFVVAAAS